MAHRRVVGKKNTALSPLIAFGDHCGAIYGSLTKSFMYLEEFGLFQPTGLRQFGLLGPPIGAIDILNRP